MAGGVESAPPLELTKWFDTNYHYLVPELGPDTEFSLASTKPVDESREAHELGIETRPVILGPVSFLLLSKPAAGAPGGFRPLDLVDALVDRYAELLTRLRQAGAAWVQLDEPAFAADRSQAELAALRVAYDRLGELTDRPALLVAGYYGDLGPALTELAPTPVEAIGIDLVAGPSSVGQLLPAEQVRDKTLVAGVVDGRNIWRTDPDAALAVCTPLLDWPVTWRYVCGLTPTAGSRPATTPRSSRLCATWSPPRSRFGRNFRPAPDRSVTGGAASARLAGISDSALPEQNGGRRRIRLAVRFLQPPGYTAVWRTGCGGVAGGLLAAR